MDLVTVYKENETVETYETIYFDDAKYNKNPPELGYRILHIIGNGVYGVVYKVECLDDRKIVAMKQTYQRNANIFKEIEIMKKLKHPNIVELKHAFYTTTFNGVNVHMVMEYGTIDLSAALYYITLNSTSELTQNCNNNGNKDVNESNEKKRTRRENRKKKMQGINRNLSHCGEVEGGLCNSEESETDMKITKKEIKNNEEKKDGKKMLNSSGENKGGRKERNEENVINADISVECQKSNNNSPNKFYVNDLNKSINNICPYHNLDEYIKKNYFNQNQIKIYLYQLIRATLYLHSLNITHRDIKPQNILIFQEDTGINDLNNSQPDDNECLVCVQNTFEKNFILYGKDKNTFGKDTSLEEYIDGIEKRKKNEKCEKSEYNKQDEQRELAKKKKSIDMQIINKTYNDNILNGDYKNDEANTTDSENVCKDSSHQEIRSDKHITNTNKIDRKKLSNNFSINRKEIDDSILNTTKKECYKMEETDNVSVNLEAKIKINKNENEKEKERKSKNDECTSFVEEKPKRKACKGNITFKYIKLCDFNTSIKLKENFKYFSYICSRYYRAPELLFGSNYYTQAIDTWSIGCVMGELILGKPLFLGECASDQLVEIIKVLGTPNDEDFLSFRSVYKDIKFPDIEPITLKKLISQNCSKDSIDLLGKLLQFNPKKRIKLYRALLHNYFDDIRNLKAFEIFDKTNNSDNKYSYSFNTNCFNFTKEELLHYTVEERKLLIPSEVREKKIDEVKQYINMSIEHFDRLYPDSVYVS